MHDDHFLPRTASVWLKRKSTLAVAAGGLIALFVWTIPNWGTFWQHVFQFPLLWQNPANRQGIISLVIKILSPLLIMGMMTILLWIFSLVRMEMQPPEDPQESGQMRLSEAITLMVRFSQSFVTRMKQKVSPNQAARFSAQPLLQRPIPQQHTAALSRHLDPVTPLPPVMPSAEALRGQLTAFGRTEEASSNQMLEPSTREDANDGKSFQDTTSLVPSSSLSFEVAAPVVATRGRIGSSDPLLSIRLLKEVTITLCVPGGSQVIVPLTPNAKRVQLLAYLAWRRGELINREKILEQVFGWGIPDEEATEDKLSERFESHKKLLRKKIREVVMKSVNKPAGRVVIDPEIDPFVSDAGFWGLADICRVDDLEEIEYCYKAISLARKDGKLIDEIPEQVKQSCDQLIAAYTGDFLEMMIKKYPGEFRSWQGYSSWARKPYTHYRDYYLEALWYAAQYEWQQGQYSVNEKDAATKETSLRKQQEHFGRAAQLYETYAMYACNSKFDAKVSFGVHGQYGERVGMSERALRRCVVLLGGLGRTDLVNQVWSAYCTQMKTISDQRWQPSQETQNDVQEALAQTNAYRFSTQISQMSSDFTERQDRPV
jgi:hypothetical protein